MSVDPLTPTLSPEGRGSPLLDIIRRRIESDGPMNLGEYMALCLGHPKHGYYMTRDPLGAAGDFTTSPEISQLFGEMIGAWLADMWIKMGKPPECILLECGPGRGTLMADIMRATKGVAGFHSAMKIHLMEMSPVLRNRQSEVLANYETRWIDDLNALNSAIPVLIIGNEFLDALPVRQLERKGGKWFERVVGLAPDNSLQIGLKEADFTLMERLQSLHISLEEGDVFEISPILNQFINFVDNLLKKQSGAALFVDYGHAKTAAGETLQAVRSHRFVKITDTPGFCDLTAHIDFENIAHIAKTDGITVHGPVTQAAFLRELGIEYRAQKLIQTLQPNASNVCGVNEPQIEAIKSGLNRLIDTQQMGILFKVLALCHDPKIIPAGFS